MGELNQYGYETTTLAEKILALQTLFQTAFGADINLSSTSPQGQIITYFATMLDNEDKIGLNLFQNYDYHNSSGEILSLLAISKGQPRKDGTKASLTATFTSSAIGYTIPANSIFAMTNDNTIEFQTLTSTTISSLTQVIALEGVNKEMTGAIITDTLTSITNLPLLTNIAILTITDGTNIETDSTLIARLDTSDTETGINDYNSITDKLNLLDNVSRVRVFDNDTNGTIESVPAHNIMAQVVGGDATEIAQTIFDNKATGTATYGNTSETIIDADGYSHTVYFNIPAVKNIWVRITVAKRNGQPIDTSLFSTLETNTQTYINNNQIGFDVSYSYVFGIWAGQNFDVSKLELSFDGSSYVETDLDLDFTEYSYMDDVATKIDIITT